MPYRIQIVDGTPDEPGALPEKDLRNFGFETLTSSDAAGALEKLSRFSPDLILTSLPKQDSLGLLKCLKESGSKVPVILVTDQQDNELKSQAAELGAKDVVSRPFPLKALVDQIASILKSGPLPPSGGRQKLLVIDDDEVILELIKIRFSMQGYDVIISQDGQSALGAVEIYEPHLIIVDLTMPGVTGWKFTQFLRQDAQYAKYSHIPIIILSGLISEPTASDSPLRGDYFVPKPFEIPLLLGKVKELLAKT